MQPRPGSPQQLPEGRRGVVLPGPSQPPTDDLVQGPSGGRGRDSDILGETEETGPSGSKGAGDTKTEGKLAEIHFAQRKGVGKIGRPLNIVVNHFALLRKMKGPLVVQQYQINVEHPRRKLMKYEKIQIIRRFIMNEREIFGDQEQWCQLATDGAHCMYSLNTLKIPNNHDTFEVVHLLESADREQTFTVEIAHVSQVHVDFSKVKSSLVHEHEYTTPSHVINIVMRQARLMSPDTNYVCAGNAFYRIPVGPGHNLGTGREAWRGFFAANHVRSNNIPLVNIDTANTAFYPNITLVEMICEMFGRDDRGGCGDGTGDYGSQFSSSDSDSGGDSSSPAFSSLDSMSPDVTLNPVQRKQLENEIKSLFLEVEGFLNREGQTCTRVCKCFGITKMGASELMFKWSFLQGPDGPEVEKTVFQFINERYGQNKLKYRNLPCVQIHPRKKNIYYPLEMCRIRKGQKCNRKLDATALRNMIKFAAIPAPQRRDNIERAVKEADLGRDRWMQTWGISVEQKMVQIKARVLPAPEIQYKTVQGQVAKVDVHEGTWRNDNCRLFEGATVNNYAVISFMSQNMAHTLSYFCDQLCQAGRRMGMKWVNEFPDVVRFIRDPNELNGVMGEVIEASRQQGAQLDLIICPLAGRNAEQYSEVKRCAEIIYGVRTQCATPSTIKNCNAQIAGNYILKINAKLGGINHQIAGHGYTRLMGSSEYPVLVLGIDVSHPKQMSELPSIAAIVGNVNMPPTKYGATIKLQKYRRDNVVDMEVATQSRLLSFFQVSKQKPKHIIVYRGGISHGQFAKVLDIELASIKSACQQLDVDYQPAVTYVVAQKGHHTRAFPVNPGDGCGKSQNVPPGTTIDTTIVSPVLNDYYQVSHFGIQGTSRPIKYTVLHDDAGVSADDIQTLSNELAHTYVRCTWATSRPAPLYYANLACTRAFVHCTRALYHLRRQDRVDVSVNSGGPGTWSMYVQTGHEEEEEEEEEKEEEEEETGDMELSKMARVLDNLSNTMYFV